MSSSVHVLLFLLAHIPGSLLDNSDDMAKPSELHLPGMPKFITEPKENSYVARGKSLKVECVASPVNHVNIRCVEKYIPRERLKVTEKIGDTKTGQRWSFYVTVNYKEVEVWFGDYWCECEAWNNIPGLDKAKFVRSRRGYIHMACKLGTGRGLVFYGVQSQLLC